jgi:phage FluMu protein Com
MKTVRCTRCNGSGEIGKRTRGDREAPGPVPDDARGWVAITCPDCSGRGEFEIEDEINIRSRVPLTRP